MKNSLKFYEINLEALLHVRGGEYLQTLPEGQPQCGIKTIEFPIYVAFPSMTIYKKFEIDTCTGHVVSTPREVSNDVCKCTCTEG